MEKVYCKNCKYKGGLCFGRVIGLEWEESYGEFCKKYCNPYIHNKNNDCKYYKRKWWKFFK